MTTNNKKGTAGTDSAKSLDKIIDAAFQRATETKWCKLSLYEIAEAADLSLSELCAHVSSKSDILAAYGRRVDSQVLKNVGEPDPAVPAKDRIFDVVMERFELMNKDREALIGIIKSIDPDPFEVLGNALRLRNTITVMLEGAGLKTTGFSGKFRQKGLGAIYLLTLREWMKDDSPDLSSTMVTLDKYLKRAEQAAGTLGLGKNEEAVIN